ncbi:MAG TPA: ATP-binding protein, partial [Bryobacteraceae bacterium]
TEYRTIGIEDGVERWISSWGRAFLDDEGLPARFVGVKLDVTARKKLEEQFRQAQKLESIGRLAGGVAHDFNNLLTVINGHSEMILERLDPRDPLHTSATEITKAGGRAAELTRQLLSFSRKQVIDPQPVNLSQLVAANRNMLTRLIGEDIELITRLEPNLDMVLADSGQLHQVLMNLVVNARDAMPQGGRLSIETTLASFEGSADSDPGQARSGEYVVLIVADDGVGMDEATRKRIFEPFFTTKGEGVGTGLGLATVYSIVQQWGGWIDLVTAPGRGTRFSIGLPRTAASAVPHSAAKCPDATAGAETLLVVEDQDEVRELALIVLKSRGYRLLEAKNAAEAEAVAARHKGPIHLLLTDVVMPGMNGNELAHHLSPRHPEMRVLFMSGYADNRPAQGNRLSEEGNYLAKPLTPAMLARKVRAALGDASPLATCAAGKN